MSDFLHWLYEHYIKPQMDGSRTEESVRCYDSISCALEKDRLEELDKILEFTAVHGFFLGLRTGDSIAKAQ